MGCISGGRLKPAPHSLNAPTTKSSQQTQNPRATATHSKQPKRQLLKQQPRPRTTQHQSQPPILEFRARPPAPELAQLLRPQTQQRHAAGCVILVQNFDYDSQRLTILTRPDLMGGPGVAQDIRTCRYAESGAVLIYIARSG